MKLRHPILTPLLWTALLLGVVGMFVVQLFAVRAFANGDTTLAIVYAVITLLAAGACWVSCLLVDHVERVECV